MNFPPTEQYTSKRLFSIRSYILFWFLLVSIAPLFLLDLTLSNWFRENQITETTHRMSQIANHRIQMLRDYVNHQQRHLTLVNQVPGFQTLFSALEQNYNNYGIDSKPYRNLRKQFVQPFTALQFYEPGQENRPDLLLITADGEVIFSLEQNDVLSSNLINGFYNDSNLAEIFLKVRDSMQPGLSHFEYYHPRESHQLFAAHPLLSRDYKTGKETLFGVIAIELDLDMIRKIVANKHEIGESGEIAIATAITHGDGAETISFLSGFTADGTTITDAENFDASPLSLALQQQQGAGPIHDPFNREIIADWRYLPDLNWAIVTRVDMSEVLVWIKESREILLYILTAFTFIIILLGFFAAHHLSTPLRSLNRWARDPATPLTRQLGPSSEINQLHNTFQSTYRELFKQKEQLNQFKEAIESSHDAIYLLTPENGRFIYLNNTAASMVGYGQEELLNRAIHDIDPTLEDISSWKNYIMPLDEIERLTERRELKTIDGQLIPVEITISKAVHLGEEFIVLNARNIREQLYHEQEMRRQLSFLESLINAIPHPIFVKNLSLQHTLCNDAYINFTGWSRALLSGMTAKEISEVSYEANEHDFSIVEAELDQKVWELQKRARKQICLKSHQGSEHEFMLSYSIFYGLDSTPAGLIGIYFDISERIAREKELQQTQSQLVHSSRLSSLGEMATGIAHEINQPLNIISLSCFQLRNPEIMEQANITADEVIHKIEEQLSRASKIINNIREFARSGNVEVELEPHDLTGPVSKALDFFRQQFRAHDIALTESYGEHLPPVLCDPNRIEQVVINLISNARFAIEEHAKQLGSEGGFTMQIDSRLFQQGQEIWIEIEDNGIGMDEETREKALEPFFTTKAVGKGTGLGLSISFGIVEEAGGTIEIDSTPGDGTTMRLRFPIAG